MRWTPGALAVAFAALPCASEALASVFINGVNVDGAGAQPEVRALHRHLRRQGNV